MIMDVIINDMSHTQPENPPKKNIHGVPSNYASRTCHISENIINISK